MDIQKRFQYGRSELFGTARTPTALRIRVAHTILKGHFECPRHTVKPESNLVRANLLHALAGLFRFVSNVLLHIGVGPAVRSQECSR